MKCIYHNDMDGRCAGALVAYVTGNRNPKDYIEADYSRFPMEKIEHGEDVFIVDYSFTPQIVEYLNKLIHEMDCYVTWIDHHDSSIRLQNGNRGDNPWNEYHIPDNLWISQIPGIRSKFESGAALTYRYFIKDAELPKFIQYVDDYDRWIYRFGKYITYFKLGLETVNHDALDHIWNELIESEEKADYLIAIGSIIKQYIDKDNAQYLFNFSYESEICGLPCLVVNKRSNSWIFADKIDDYPIVVTFVFDGTQYNYSLYSSDSVVDCSKIAESYGGGGHKSAAGIRSKELIFPKRNKG